MSSPRIPAPRAPVLALPYADEEIGGHAEVRLDPQYARLLLSLMETAERLKEQHEGTALTHSDQARVRFCFPGPEATEEGLDELLEGGVEQPVLAEAAGWDSTEDEDVSVSLRISPSFITVDIETTEKNIGTLLLNPVSFIRKGDLLRYLLRTAPDAEVPALLARLAEAEPEMARQALEEGVRLECEPREYAREVHRLLTDADLAPLLSSEDASLRMAAIPLVGQQAREAPAPETTAPVQPSLRPRR